MLKLDVVDVCTIAARLTGDMQAQGITTRGEFPRLAVPNCFMQEVTGKAQMWKCGD